MQRAILSSANSEGLIDFRSMLDHLWSLFPGASREAFIDEVGKNLIKLWRLGDLYLERKDGVERRTMTVDEWKHFSLREFVVWDGDSHQWALSQKHEELQDLFVQLSQGGIDDLRRYESH
jgi:hypothetical protein